MPHANGRAQVNVIRGRGSGYGTMPTFLNQCYHAGWSLGTVDEALKFNYVNQANGSFKVPPSGDYWRTGQLRLFGANNQVWIVTWEGNAQPNLIMVNPYSDLYTESLVLTSNTANRKVYRLNGINQLPVADHAPTAMTGDVRWINPDYTGEYGWSILSQMLIQGQTTEVANLRLFRAEHEANVLAGEIYTPEFSNIVKNWGVIRWMDEFSSNPDPNAGQWSQYANNTIKFLDYSMANDGITVNASIISTNHFQIPTMNAYPNGPEDRMALRIRIPEWRMQKCNIWNTNSVSPIGTVPANTTYIRWINHGFSNNDIIQRVRYYYGDSPQGSVDLLANNSYYGNTGLTHIYMVSNVHPNYISISANTQTISVSGWSAGNNQIHFMIPFRIRYGSNTESYYCHAGYDGHWGILEWQWEQGSDRITGAYSGKGANGVYSNTTMYGILVKPLNRPLANANFIFGTGRADRQPNPLELVDICNRANSHCWLHIPPLASDDLIDKFAIAVRDRLDTGIEAWFELGNELWNDSQKTFPWPRIFNGLTHSGFANYNFSGWPQRRLVGHHIRNMMMRIKTIFNGSGKTAKFVIGGQCGAWTFDENDHYGLGLDNSSWYAANTRPGDLADYVAWGLYQNHPAWEHPTGGADLFSNTFYINALTEFVANNKNTAFNIMRDSRLDYLEQGVTSFCIPGGAHYNGWSAKYPQVKFIMYEGGFHHFASYGYYRSAQNYGGFTDYQGNDLFWQYRRSNQYGQLVEAYANMWVSKANCVYPSHYVLIDTWLREAVYSLTHWNTPYANNSNIPAYHAFRTFNDATLILDWVDDPLFEITSRSAISTSEGTTPNNGGTITFTVSRSGGPNAALITYSVEGSGANPISSNDVIGGTGNRTLTFNIGETSKQFTITTNPDAFLENNEGVSVALVSSNVGNVNTASWTFTILDDDYSIPPNQSGGRWRLRPPANPTANQIYHANTLLVSGKVEYMYSNIYKSWIVTSYIT